MTSRATRFAVSTLGLEIPSMEFSSGYSDGRKVLILGGVHGDEKEGVILAHGLIAAWSREFKQPFAATIVPMFNLDGVILGTRVNANGVDLNRNLPTQDWNPQAFNERYPPGPHANSEIENQALTQFLTKFTPQLIVSLHSWKPLLNVNGACREFAESVSEKTGYVIEESIGYPTPGCLGTYAGLERSMPTLTYEVERGLPARRVIDEHVPALLYAFQRWGEKK